MARDERSEEALAEAKTWLASALEKSGHTKASLQRDTGVGTRTITTIFATGDGLANGVNLYQVLKALELLKDPPGEQDTVTARLGRIEAIAQRLDAALRIQNEVNEAQARLQQDGQGGQQLPEGQSR